MDTTPILVHIRWIRLGPGTKATPPLHLIRPQSGHLDPKRPPHALPQSSYLGPETKTLPPPHDLPRSTRSLLWIADTTLDATWPPSRPQSVVIHLDLKSKTTVSSTTASPLMSLGSSDLDPRMPTPFDRLQSTHLDPGTETTTVPNVRLHFPITSLPHPQSIHLDPGKEALPPLHNRLRTIHLDSTTTPSLNRSRSSRVYPQTVTTPPGR